MTSSKKKKLPHIIINVLSYLILAGGLARFIMAYGSLDYRIGVHFSMHGFFDVYYDKWLGFYPFVLSFLVCIFCGVFDRIIQKVRISQNTTIHGDELIRKCMRIFLDLFQFIMVGFYSGYWSHCVITEQPMPTWVRPFVLVVIIVLIAATATFLIGVYRICRNKW